MGGTTIISPPEVLGPEGGSPEGQVSPAADVWSLGCTLYQLLTRQLLFGSRRSEQSQSGSREAQKPGGGQLSASSRGVLQDHSSLDSQSLEESWSESESTTACRLLVQQQQAQWVSLLALMCSAVAAASARHMPTCGMAMALSLHIESACPGRQQLFAANICM